MSSYFYFTFWYKIIIITSKKNYWGFMKKLIFYKCQFKNGQSNFQYIYYASMFISIKKILSTCRNHHHQYWNENVLWWKIWYYIGRGGNKERGSLEEEKEKNSIRFWLSTIIITRICAEKTAFDFDYQRLPPLQEFVSSPKVTITEDKNINQHIELTSQRKYNQMNKIFDMTPKIVKDIINIIKSNESEKNSKKKLRN